jgi:hypothetical protein
MKKQTKFILEKFEIAKLSNLKKIRGGFVGDSSLICTLTDTKDDSSADCIKPVKPIKTGPTNQNPSN